MSPFVIARPQCVINKEECEALITLYREPVVNSKVWSLLYTGYCITAVLNTVLCLTMFNTLRPRQNGRHFADDTFKCVFLSENVRVSIEISLKFVPKDPINSNPALVQIMAWHRSGDKPLYEPMMVRLLLHICVTRPHWVNGVWLWHGYNSIQIIMT